MGSGQPGYGQDVKPYMTSTDAQGSGVSTAMEVVFIVAASGFAVVAAGPGKVEYLVEVTETVYTPQFSMLTIGSCVDKGPQVFVIVAVEVAVEGVRSENNDLESPPVALAPKTRIRIPTKIITKPT